MDKEFWVKIFGLQITNAKKWVYAKNNKPFFITLFGISIIKWRRLSIKENKNND